MADAPGPGRQQATAERRDPGEGREGDGQVEGEHQQVLRLAQQPRVEARSRERGGDAEHHAAEQADTQRRPAARRAAARWQPAPPSTKRSRPLSR